MASKPNYFTCTLGEAATLKQSKTYRTVPEFVDHQAEHHSDLPAFGSYTPQLVPKPWTHQVFTFGDVQRRTQATAIQLRDVINSPKGQTVALLWPSSIEFLFIWLGLMYLGHPVFLVAPQCSAAAVASLCRSCDVGVVIGHDSYRKLVGDACVVAEREGWRLKAPEHELLGTREVVEGGLRAPSRDYRVDANLGDVAYLHHTSGTSSGTPKPIPQTHHGGLVVLPRLGGSDTANFTTTPLYHGGIADLFRAWTSNAMIWLFPGADVPITATNVTHCLAAADLSHQEGNSPPVGYFSSVPYVLQMLAADEQGLEHLKRMQIVGVGGAALPAEVGDDLVRHSVNLVSRYGSAECGFLLSSERDFNSDIEWQYLRHSADVKTLHFEEREGGLHQLIVDRDWPHMAKRNKDDGGYATSDLFERHPQIRNAWRYHSRSDSQLTLITGKKFDPAPIEASITASTSMITDALIFGEGQAYPGALLFRSADAVRLSDSEILGEVRPVVQKLNAESQAHARIPLEMLIPMPPTEIEKSSKGTVLRGIATKRFSREIEVAYAGSDTSLDNFPDNELTPSIIQAVSVIVGTDIERLTPEADMFSYGIDSVASIQIRGRLTQLLPKGSPKLPMTIVQDCGTIANLAAYILALRNGETPQSHTHTNQEDIHKLMLDLVAEYSTLPTAAPPPLPNQNNPSTSRTTPFPSPSSSNKSHTILLTGSTGTLGAHLLHHLLTHASHLRISHIYLLVRGSTPNSARARVMKALSSRSLSIACSSTSTSINDLITVLPSTLSSPHLGLEIATYHSLVSRVTHVYHLAWHVNFLLPVPAFRAHFAGIRNLLGFCAFAAADRNQNLSGGGGRRDVGFTFCSSTASVSSSSSEGPVPEQLRVWEICGAFTAALASASASGGERNGELSASGRDSGRGEDKGKGRHYVNENGDEKGKGNDNGNVKVDIVRVGQLSGSTHTGCWSKSEAYPLMLSAAKLLGRVPDLDQARRRLQLQQAGIRVNKGVREAEGHGQGSDIQGTAGEECAWIPVDVAAGAFADLLPSLSSHADSSSAGEDDCADGIVNAAGEVAGEGQRGVRRVRVLHLLPRPTARHSSWSDVVGCILKVEPEDFPMVEVEEWLGRLEGLRGTVDRDGCNQNGDGSGGGGGGGRGGNPGGLDQKDGGGEEDALGREKEKEREGDHPALQLAAFWREAYCSSPSAISVRGNRTSASSAASAALNGLREKIGCTSEAGADGIGRGIAVAELQGVGRAATVATMTAPTTTGRFEMTRSLQAMPTLVDRPVAVHLDEGYIAKCWEWIKVNV